MTFQRIAKSTYFSKVKKFVCFVAELVQFKRHRKIHMLNFLGLLKKLFCEYKIKLKSIQSLNGKCYLLKAMQYILAMKRKECLATLSNLFFSKVKPLVILGNAGVLQAKKDNTNAVIDNLIAHFKTKKCTKCKPVPSN